MTLDDHSKNVCLIGVLHMVAYLVISMDPIKAAFNEKYFPAYDSYPSGSMLEHLALAGYFILMSVLSGLMIRGVEKKCHIFLAPFLLMSTLFLILMSISVILDLDLDIGSWINICEDRLYMIGITIMAVYPTYTLYTKLRSETEAEKPLKKGNLIICA